MASGTLTLSHSSELDLDATLASGQIFRWNQDSEGIWSGWHGSKFLRLQQNDLTLYWEGLSEAVVRDFLRLDDIDLAAHAETWVKVDPAFAEAWALQSGVRILRQDPHGCFFSFLCAANANIPRIGQMIAAFAPPGGPFPPATTIAQLSEATLRARGLGFRAPRVEAAAKALGAQPEDTLTTLRGKPLEEIQTVLTAHNGIGRKIADCIALFSLDADSAVPVDTHIWQISCALYTPELKGKSLTPANYQSVVDAFHARFGEKAGWAQQILFYRRAIGKD
ncbi:MAG: DNA glycosylase [Armatimonas sp.]